MTHLVFGDEGEARGLDRPILIAAWSGWNDAGESATGAIRFMLRRWRAKAAAHIDPEQFYDFTQTRPRVRLDQGERYLEWPRNEFSPHRREDGERDLVLLLGIEPHLSWHAYSDTVLECCEAFGVSTVITLGALLAEASHARPIRVSGSSEDPGLREELRASEQKRGEAQRLAERIPSLEQMLGQKGNELGVANEQIAKLERDVKREREDKESAEAQVKSLEQELHAERVKSSTFRAAIAEGPARGEAAEDGIAAPAEFTFRGVAELAREALDRLEIPDGALSDLQVLDRATNAAVRAEDTWRALRALHEYAGEAEHINGGFYEWCQYSHSPHVLPTNKVAMKESDTVQNSAPLRDKRRFEVAREVDPTGRMVMFAHLKPVEGGGEDIPRIYFLDDTGGRTKKIHIGAISPHSRFPNTKS